MNIVVVEYLDRLGTSPYRNWLNSLPVELRAKLQARIFRVSEGNLGDYKSLGGGVNEFRIHFEVGYRIYFAFSGKSVVLLLAGGTKKSQRKDIIAAKSNWLDYKKKRQT
jgi:putative addiction module killer protein